MTLDQSALKMGATVDLHGAVVHVANPLLVPPGCCTIRNGVIHFDGNNTVVASGGMCCINTNPKSGRIIIEDLRVEMNDRCAVVGMFNGGFVTVRNVSHFAGAIALCQGGDSLTIQNCWSYSTPDKYWLLNATNLLKHLQVDNSGCPHQIHQGQNEAAVRLMQVNESHIVGLKVKGSGYKQAVQDRPGGSPHDTYEQHVWEKCEITGGLDLGNFKDKESSNFPFGVLKLSRWTDCAIDYYNTTAQGNNGIGKAMGIDRIELINTKVGGKVTNKTIAR